MFDIYFIILFLAIPFVAIKILQISGVHIRHVSIVSVFFVFYMIVAYSGIVGMYFGWSEYWINLGVIDRDIILQIFFYSSISLLAISLTILFSSRVLGLQSMRNTTINRTLSSIGLLLILLLVLLCLLVTIIYIRQLPGLPILAALKGDAEEVAFLRSEATNAFPGKYHRYAMFMHNLLPFLALVLFSHALCKGNLRSWLTFLTVGFFTIFTVLISTEKGPFFLFIICLGFTYLITRGKVIRNEYILPACVVGIVLLVPMYLFFIGMYGRSISEIFSAIANRVFSEIVPAYFYLLMIPEKVGFLYGRTLPNPSGIIAGYQPYPITNEVHNIIWPQLMDSGVVGSAPTVYWAELYANFGFIGPVIFSPILGFFLYAFDVLLSRLPSSPVRAALIAWLAVHLMKIASTMLSNFLVDLDMYLIILVSALLLFIEGGGKITIAARLHDVQ